MAIYAVQAIASIALVSALAVGSAVTQKAIAPKPKPTHAIRGVVKAINTFYVVVTTGSGKKSREMTFMLTPSTEKGGEITIGAMVSVRYRQEGRTFVSTAVSAQPDKQRAQIHEADSYLLEGRFRRAADDGALRRKP
jgi:hypothetical protein